MATLFYGLVGGFAVLAVAGYVAEKAAKALGDGESRKTNRLIILFSAMAALGGVLVMATLDKVIGPW